MNFNIIFNFLNKYTTIGEGMGDRMSRWLLIGCIDDLAISKSWGKMTLPIRRALMRVVRYACDNNHWNVLRMLVRLRKNINFNKRDQNGHTLLTRAVKESEPRIVKMLLDNGTHPDIYSFSGYTPLMLATHFEKVEIVELLMKYNPNVSLKSYGGSTAVSLALGPKKTLIERIILGIY